MVSTLAARHKIQVSLRRSVYGGTTAIVVLPFGVIVREGEPGSAPGQAPFGVTGRHRVPATVPATATATGPRADTGVPQAPPAATLAPWEYGPPEPEPQARGLSSAPWEIAAPSSFPQAFHRTIASREPRTDGQEHQNAQSRGSASDSRRESRAPGAASGGHLGMPIRVPQASLAPQLQGSDTGPRAAVHAGSVIDERSPEATRNIMMSMQQGWQRGRVADLDDPEGAPASGTDR